MNFISSVKDKMADRLKYDGSYEQIIKFYVYLRSPFAGGGRDKGAGSARMLAPVLLLCGLFAALCLCWMVKGVLLSLRLDADIAAAEARVPARVDQGKKSSSPQTSPTAVIAALRRSFIIEPHPLSSASR